MDKKTIFKLILILAVCTAGFFGYRYFFGQTDENLVGVTTVGADGQVLSDQPVTDYESQQFLILLASVKDVGTKLREDFVSDPFFRVLKDYTVPVSAKPISRANPFLPIGVGGPYLEVDNSAAVDAPTTTPVIATTSEAIASTTKSATKTTQPAAKTTKPATVKKTATQTAPAPVEPSVESEASEVPPEESF